MWTKPVIIYTSLWLVAGSAGFAFGPVAAFGGFVAVAALAFAGA